MAIEGCENLHLLHQAARLDVKELLLDTLSHGENANSLDGLGRTALHDAAFQGHVECLKILIEHGGDPKHVSPDGLTVLHRAALGGHMECVKYLLAIGCIPSDRGSSTLTPAQSAKNEGYRGVARYLDEIAANYEAKKGKQRDLYDLIVTYCNDGDLLGLEEIISSEPGILDQAFGKGSADESLLHWLCSACLSCRYSIVTYATIEEMLTLPSMPCHLSASPLSVSRQSPLHLLCAAHSAPHNLYLLHVLLCHAAMLRSAHLAAVAAQDRHAVDDLLLLRDDRGRTPLHVALESGHLLAVCQMFSCAMPSDSESSDSRASWQSLVHSWAHVADDNGQTAYHVAARQAKQEMLRSLLSVTCKSVGCTVNGGLDVLCAKGFPPLVTAILADMPENAALLVKSGASVTQQCGQRQPAPSELTDVQLQCPGFPLYPWLTAYCQGYHALAYDLLTTDMIRAVLEDDSVMAQPLSPTIIFMLNFPRLVSAGVNQVDDGQGKLKTSWLVKLAWKNIGLRLLRPDWARIIVDEHSISRSNDYQLLTHLDISKNRLTCLDGAVLSSLPSLMVLDCSHNHLTQLPEFPNAQQGGGGDGGGLNIKQLVASGNQLRFLPDSLFELPAITRIVVCNNSLDAVPECVWTAPKLSSLQLDFNLISSFPDPPLWRPVCSGGYGENNRDVTQNEAAAAAVLPSGYQSLPARVHGTVRQQNVTRTRIAVASATAASSPPLPRASASLYPSASNRHRAITAQRVVCANDALSDTTSTVTPPQDSSSKSWSFLCASWRSRSYKRRQAHPGYGIRSKQVLDDQLLDSDQSTVGMDVQVHTHPLFSPLLILSLSHNRLKHVPRGLSCFAPHMRRLNLSYNPLSSFASISAYPSSLEDLNLHCCESAEVRFGIMPESLFSNPSGACFCRAGVAVQPSLRYCRNSSHRQLPLLEMLDVSGNNLSSVALVDCHSANAASTDPLHSVVTTSSVQAASSSTAESSSTVDVMHATPLFPRLTNLDLHDNSLHQVPAGIGQLRGLRSLRLANNRRIQSLPDELGNLPPNNLCELDFKGIELLDPPATITNTGISTTLAFLRGRLKKSVPYRHMKLMLVGLEDQGKTSLVRLLRREGHGNATILSTVGVDLGSWECKPPRRTIFSNQSALPVQFSTWDFAGQREYYATHQCFLTSRSIFLAVWKITSGPAGLLALDDWLRNIQARVPGATVVIVGTHLDKVNGGLRHCTDVWLPALHKRYFIKSAVATNQEEHGFPHIVAVKFVSCVGSGTNVDDLCACIYETACAIPSLKRSQSKEKIVEEQVPASYIALQDAVSSFRSSLPGSTLPILSDSQFRKHFSSIVGDVDELKVAVRFLHDNGVLLHFDDSRLKDFYFIDPQWLCDVLARVVTVREVMPFSKDGILPIRSLSHVFNSVKFPAKLANVCVQLLGKFEVAIQLDLETLLIPSQLPELPPAQAKLDGHSSNWSVRGCQFQRVYLMVYVPSGFWPLLITRLLASELKVDMCTYASCFVDLTGDTVHWRLWRRGVQLVLEDTPIVSMEEVSAADLFKHLDTTPASVVVQNGSKWEPLVLLDTARCLHVTVLDFRAKQAADTPPPPVCTDAAAADHSSTSLVDADHSVGAAATANDATNKPEQQDEVYLLQAKLLTECTYAIDSLLSDWYPGIGDRNRCMSTGTPYITRCHICPMCRADLTAPGILWENLQSAVPATQPVPVGALACLAAPGTPPPVDGMVTVFLLDQLVSLACHGYQAIQCHNHGITPLADMAPDINFSDFKRDTLIPSTSVICGELLGAGSFGEVFRGTVTTDLGRKDVAIKRFQRVEQLHAAHSSADEELIANQLLSISAPSSTADSFCCLRQEAAVLQHLHHQNVVALDGVTLNPPALLLEWAPQGALDSLVASFSGCLDEMYGAAAITLTLPPYILWQILQQVAAGLQYVHNLSIIYRDLKAENILVWAIPSAEELATSLQEPCSRSDTFRSAVHVKLSDYGISRVSGTGSVRGLAGTPGFMAPEIVAHSGTEGYTQQVDIFSYGMLMYELMTLAHPYAGVIPSYVQSLVQRGILPYPTSRVMNQPVQLQHLMLHCTAAEANTRPQTNSLVQLIRQQSVLFLADGIPLPQVRMQRVIDVSMSVSTDRASPGKLWLLSGGRRSGETQSVHRIAYAAATASTQVDEIQLLEKLDTAYLCSTGAYMWTFSRTGHVCIVDTETLTVCHKWNVISSTHQSHASHPDTSVQCVHFVPRLNRVFIGLGNGVLLSYTASLDDLIQCTDDTDGVIQQSHDPGDVIQQSPNSSNVTTPRSRRPSDVTQQSHDPGDVIQGSYTPGDVTPRSRRSSGSASAQDSSGVFQHSSESGNVTEQSRALGSSEAVADQSSVFSEASEQSSECTDATITQQSNEPNDDVIQPSHESSPGLLVSVLRSVFLMVSVDVGRTARDTQLWCGHANGMITVLRAQDMCVLATLQQSESTASPLPLRTVMLAAHDTSTVGHTTDQLWTAACPSSRVYGWATSATASNSPCNVAVIDCCADSDFPDSVVINDLSCASDVLVVALSNGYLVVINTCQHCIVRKVRLHPGPMQFVRIMTFENDVDFIRPSAWCLHRQRARSWLPLYLQALHATNTAEGALYRAAPMILTGGHGLNVPTKCQPVYGSRETRVNNSFFALGLWDGRMLLSPDSN
eukprot:scpid3967/ scgid3954/ Leucine-rich repeat serine/threonine-protein kinase 1; Leucine-rich repeats, ras-like domain, kinase protein 1; PARK8-related kinase